MDKCFKKILDGYKIFREKYVKQDQSILQNLAYHGQSPEIMIISCCDSRVDPAVILQCDPGDLFTVRNIANIVPPFEQDEAHHGTSAALEFGIRVLNVKHLILIGHTHCGGIETFLFKQKITDYDFINNWLSLIKVLNQNCTNTDDFAQATLYQSYNNLLTFPWVKEKIDTNKLTIHLWFFDIENGEVFFYCADKKQYIPLR